MACEVEVWTGGPSLLPAGCPTAAVVLKPGGFALQRVVGKVRSYFGVSGLQEGARRGKRLLGRRGPAGNDLTRPCRKRVTGPLPETRHGPRCRKRVTGRVPLERGSGREAGARGRRGGRGPLKDSGRENGNEQSGSGSPGDVEGTGVEVGFGASLRALMRSVRSCQ